MAAIINDESSNNDDVSPHFNRVIELLKLTLKTVILINGGGAIAILTLIGGILSSGLDAVPPLLAWAIGCFQMHGVRSHNAQTLQCGYCAAPSRVHCAT